jgi:uncharacterized protein (TIRG00374 family)
MMGKATGINGAARLCTCLRSGLRWSAALLLAGITAWLSTSKGQVDWRALQAALAHPHWLLLALALGSVLATTAAKAARWRALLRPCQTQASGGRILRVLFVGQMLNTLIPRLGDVARAVLLGSQAAGGMPAVLGTLLAEKALDGAVGLLILIGLSLWTPLPAWLRGPVLALAALTGGLLLLLILAAAQRGWAVRLFRLAIAWLPPGSQQRAGQLLADFGLGLGLLRQPANALGALAWSAVVWGLAASTNVLTLAALDVDAPAWSTWLVLVAGYVATFLPTVPAQIGVFEYACILALGAAGVGPEPALAFGLVLHFLVYAPPSVLGSISMAVEGLSWTGLRKAQRRYLERGHV